MGRNLVLEQVLADGCRHDLDVPAIVAHSPFADIRAYHVEMVVAPRTHKTTYRGIAVE